MGKIYVLGLRSGDIESQAPDMIEELNRGYRTYLKTEDHPIVEYLRDRNMEYTSYDHIYGDDIEPSAICSYIADDLIDGARSYGRINYLASHNPLIAEGTVRTLLQRNIPDVEVQIVASPDPLIDIIGPICGDPIGGLKIIDGTGFDFNDMDINLDIIVLQAHNRGVIENLRRVLSLVYEDEYIVYVIGNTNIVGRRRVSPFPIGQLNEAEDIEPSISIYIPKVDKIDKKIYSLADIMDTMKILRGDKGCPWDRQQTHMSIRECMIEEAYEAVDAIDSGDIDGLIEELGDVLLQVIFHSQIALEAGRFNLYDITTQLNKKLIYRHNHIFDDKKVEGTDEVVYNWDKMKYKDRNLATYTDYLNDVPRLPSLMRGFKVQQRASKIGFDWDDVGGALTKVMEEYREVLESIDEVKGGGMDKVEEELGDLLFAVVNVSRFLGINPEVALNRTINKFIGRFQFMEEKSTRIGKKLEDMSLEEMDLLWDEAKQYDDQ
ncbi:MAG: nucleoside triphosphate pyrophosphohydrolase [Tissierellia bacterium]|nr:nucleoside triphosphate pyrophosphohydrolase [Tissierellia bacterium]